MRYPVSPWIFGVYSLYNNSLCGLWALFYVLLCSPSGRTFVWEAQGGSRCCAVKGRIRKQKIYGPKGCTNCVHGDVDIIQNKWNIFFYILLGKVFPDYVRSDGDIRLYSKQCVECRSFGAEYQVDILSAACGSSWHSSSYESLAHTQVIWGRRPGGHIVVAILSAASNV